MKKSSILVFALISIFFIGVTNQSCAQKEDIQKIAIKTMFHCANGKALIEKELAKVDGVKGVVADVETKLVTIKYDGAKLNKEKLVAEIEKTGYSTEFTAKDTKINKACSHGEGEKK